MIQTDAPISPGSSGGALLDGSGRVIGITTAVAVSDVGPEGLGFATAIDVAKSIADELVATGKATHVWIGINGADLDGSTAHDLNLDGGARVRSVVGDGPAQKGGMADNDIIVSLGGKPVGSMGALVAALRQYRPGDVVAVEVIRDRQKSTKTVTLLERPAGQ